MFEQSLQAIGIYVGFNLLINLFLAYRVSAGRLRSNVMSGTEGDDGLYNASRAHTLNVEYVPLALIALITLHILSAPVWLLHVVGIFLTLGRILSAIGVSRSRESSPARLYGTLLTWVAQLVAALGCLFFVAT